MSIGKRISDMINPDDQPISEPDPVEPEPVEPEPTPEPEPVVEQPITEAAPAPVAHTQNRRMPRAAGVLRNQLMSMYPGTPWGSDGEPDGFGVVREVWFGGEAAVLLKKALPVLEDPRIEVYTESEDRVTLTFVSSHFADGVQDFQLEAAAVVAGAEVGQGNSYAADVVRIEAERIQAAAAANQAEYLESNPDPSDEGEPVQPVAAETPEDGL